jgi:DNA replication and repair protein RecF
MESTTLNPITTTGITDQELLRVKLERLSLYQFKNYASAELHFSAPVVCFLGNNGSGKTNLLDAIHYLSFSKSYFNTADSQNVLHGEDQCSITGDFVRGDMPEHVVCTLRKGLRKVFKRNHKEYDRLADHIGLLPSVIITPYDAELIYEGSEVRRKFIDSTISQRSSVYLDHLIQYNQALQQRNNLLKQMGDRGTFSEELLEPWDFQLTTHGAVIYEMREAFIAEFTPLFEHIYQFVTLGKETPTVTYESDLKQGGLEPLLLKSRQKDRVLERTCVGIHKDELEFGLNGLSLKKYASQGQQKSFLISLKLAQLAYLKQHLKINPLLLLDDLYDKVDDQRVSRLLLWLKENPCGQVFITDTSTQRIPAILQSMDMPMECFEVQDAQIALLNFN